MRSSSILCVLGAALAAAGPVQHNHKELHKKAIVWDIVTDTVWVTVTATGPSHGPVFVEKTVVVEAIEATTTTTPKVKHTTTHHTTTTTTTTIPPPPPTTTTQPPPPPTTTVAPIIILPSPSPVTSSGSAPAGYQNAVLYYHNLHRANHSSPDLSWDEKLAGYAATTAAKCVFAHDMDEGDGGYGQNIDASGYSNPVPGWDTTSVAAYAITDQWYNGEAPDYTNYYGEATPPFNGAEILHFTQVVWKGTHTVGCASQYCPYGSILGGSYGWFTVCNYGPTGKSPHILRLIYFTANISP